MKLGLLLLIILSSVSLSSAQPPTGVGGTTGIVNFYPLTVTKTGSGTGTVIGPEINCGNKCGTSYVAGVTTQLIATAAVGATFTGWSGDCSGSNTCIVNMNSPKSVIATFTLAAVGPQKYASPLGTAGSNDCSDRNTPCTVLRMLEVLQPGDFGNLLNGTYTHPQILDLYYKFPGKSGFAGQPITVRAENDGGAIFDGAWGAGANPFDAVPLETLNNSYWTFEGFDIIRGGVSIWGGNNLIIRRVCASNAQPVPLGPGGSGNNAHVWSINGFNTASLYEDVCGFGTGRNILMTSFQGAGTSVFRRFWTKHEGYAGWGICDIGPGLQLAYHDNEPYFELYENLISLLDQKNLQPGNSCYCPITPCAGSAGLINGHWWGQQHYGFIAYLQDNNSIALNLAGMWIRNDNCPSLDPFNKLFVDMYIDVRNQLVPPFITGFINPGCLTLSRITGLRAPDDLPTNSNSTNGSSFDPDTTVSNWHDCATPGACPNFYTGIGPGGIQGARNCYEYENGVLQDGTGGTTAKPLWPWPMDDRIKTALAREFLAGRGGYPLNGTGGTGYQSGTVTSDIVSRYGAIPSQCNKFAGGFITTENLIVTAAIFIILASAFLAQRKKGRIRI